MSQMLEKLDALFLDRAKKPSACVEQSCAKEVLVYDDTLGVPQVAKFRSPEGLSSEEIEALYFKIINPGGHELNLIRLDNDFFNQRPGGTCDAVVFSQFLWLFLEFKMEARSRSPLTMQDNLVKAVNQLGTIVKFFLHERNLSQTFPDLEFEANVCCPPHFPRDTASFKALAVSFLEEFHMMLHQRNSFEFPAS